MICRLQLATTTTIHQNRSARTSSCTRMERSARVHTWHDTLFRKKLVRTQFSSLNLNDSHFFIKATWPEAAGNNRFHKKKVYIFFI